MVLRNAERQERFAAGANLFWFDEGMWPGAVLWGELEHYLLRSDHDAFNKRAFAPFFDFMLEQVATWIETPRLMVM